MSVSIVTPDKWEVHIFVYLVKITVTVYYS